MTANRRIFLNLIATYKNFLYALAIGLFGGRWTLMALGKVDYGLKGVVGGLTVVAVWDALVWGTMFGYEMNVRAKQNRFGRGVRCGRDGEVFLRRSRNPLHSIPCTEGSPLLIRHYYINNTISISSAPSMSPLLSVKRIFLVIKPLIDLIKALAER